MNKKRAIIVGASSGIGRCMAQQLVADGWAVGAAARRDDLLQDLGAACTAKIDVTAEDAPRLLEELIERLGGIDLYIHAAGIGKQNPQLEADIELPTVRTNADGFARMVGAAFRHMASHGGGQIACITSVAATKGLGPAPSYSATKAFQTHYLEALQQLANARRLGIRLTDIRPGFVDTPLLNSANRYPMLMQPDDVARKALRAIRRGRQVATIDLRWRLLVALWRAIPTRIWRKIKLGMTNDE